MSAEFFRKIYKSNIKFLNFVKASAIWLMVMMKTKECIERPAVQSHLIDLHNAFQLLLTEADGEF